jgi:hypothetical protein
MNDRLTASGPLSNVAATSVATGADRSAAGVGVNAGIAQAGVQVTAGTEQLGDLARSVVNAVVEDVRQDIQVVRNAVACGNAAGCAH